MKTRLRELAPAARGSQDEGSRNLAHFLAVYFTEVKVIRGRREEGAVKRLRGRGCLTVAAATAPALLGQV